MEVDLSGLNETYLNAERPYEKMVVLYIQIYERMMPLLKNTMSLEEWDTILISFDKMVQYLSEIKDWDLTEEFRSMRDMYLDIIKESIVEIEEVINDD